LRGRADVGKERREINREVAETAESDTNDRGSGRLKGVKKAVDSAIVDKDFGEIGIKMGDVVDNMET
jgi:hypothetical protein